MRDLLRRHDRKRRNQRIAAGMVGIAVFVAAVWPVTTGGPFDRAAVSGQRPGASGTPVPSVAPIAIDAPAVEPTPALGPGVPFGGGHRGIGSAGSGSLSPDGSLVTMLGHEVGGPGALRFMVNADGTELRYIRGRNSNPAGMWSPDGSRIVCLQPDMRHGGIIVVDVVTGDALRVTKGSEAIWLDGYTLLVEV